MSRHNQSLFKGEFQDCKLFSDCANRYHKILSCVQRFLECQMDHVTEIILALVCSWKRGTQSRSHAQVMGEAEEDESRSRVAQVLVRRCSEYSSGTIPFSTLHQKTLIFGTTLSFHRAFHTC